MGQILAHVLSLNGEMPWNLAYRKRGLEGLYINSSYMTLQQLWIDAVEVYREVTHNSSNKTKKHTYIIYL